MKVLDFHGIQTSKVNKYRSCFSCTGHALSRTGHAHSPRCTYLSVKLWSLIKMCKGR